MAEREFKIPEFLKKEYTGEKEKTELDILEEEYRKKFGDNDYTTAFIESDEDQIRVLKKCLKENRRFDDVAGLSDMRRDGNFL